MIITKFQFFLLLSAIVILPFLVIRIIWLAGSETAIGTVQGTAHGTGFTLGQDAYALISFKAGKDTIWIHGTDKDYEDGAPVTVRYKRNDPSDAVVNDFGGIWSNSLKYSAVPFIFVLALFVGSDIIPKGSRVQIGKKPFIKILTAKKTSLIQGQLKNLSIYYLRRSEQAGYFTIMDHTYYRFFFF